MMERIEGERLRQGVELYADIYEQDEELQDLFDSLCISMHILYIPVGRGTDTVGDHLKNDHA